MTDAKPPLSLPHVQSALLAEAARSAAVGFLVWDDDRCYVAANPRACEILGCTLEDLIGSVVGARTEDGEALVHQVVQNEGGQGEMVATRFDGKQQKLGFVTFATRIGGIPYMASVIWPLA
jgi:PAS domain S-box-containing protein